MDIKVMTYNIQHGHVHLSNPGRIDLSVMADVIRDEGADIIGLNEVRGRGDHPDYTAQTEFMAGYLGYHGWFGRSFYVGGWNPYGNAIVSSVPILATEVIPIPDPPLRKYDGYYETRCVLRAVLDLGRPFTVFASHFGLNPDEAENAVDTVVKAVSKCGTPFCFQGDLNLKPEDPLMRPLFEIMTDTAVAADGPVLTFASDNPYEKIDYIFVSRDVRAERFRVPVVIASDHSPCYAEIRF